MENRYVVCAVHVKMSWYFQVTKILIDKHRKKVKGVEYFKDGQYRTIRVRKEVIVSAGAIQSPQLLMLSGIGPKDHLKSVGTCETFS
jgi:choline dehydrogenase-like flavoprotein